MASETQAAIDYAHAFYKLMEERAKLNEYHELVYTGSLTKLYKELGASSAYYSRIRKILVEGGNIEFMVRGTRVQESQIRLLGAPEKDLTQRPEVATMGAEVERRLASLEAWRETTGGLNIAEALRNVELRLQRLESLTGGKD